jgi:glycosyltransferase involved in cell wall biosynthesis
MKKVCFLIGYYPINRGGAEYQAYLLSQELRDRLEIFYISVGHEREECIIDNNMKIYTLKSPAFFCFRDIYFLLKLKIFNILKQEKPALIYQNVAYSATGIAAKYCQENNCKLMWHVASKSDVTPFKFEFKNGIIFSYIEKKFLEYGIRKANFIFGQAKYQDKLLQKNYNLKCDLIIPNFHPKPIYRIEKENPVKVVWVANMKKLKQPELFVKLAQKFENKNYAQFIMIGKPAQERWQKNLERHLNSLSNLEYLSDQNIEEVNKVLCKSHIFVNTSKYEGFPNTFIQAWMRENPTVSLNVDPDDLIKKNKLGFHSGSFEQMVKDVRFLIEDKKVREEMGRNARKYALREHDIKKIVPKYVELFEKVVTE